MAGTLSGMLNRIHKRHAGHHVVDVDDTAADKTVDVQHRHPTLVVDRLRDDNHDDPLPTGMGNSGGDSVGQALTTTVTIAEEGDPCMYDK